MSTVALNFVGGIPFQLLYDGIKIATRRTSKFRSNLISLQFTLDCLQSRIIEQIGDNNVELNLPNNIIEGIQTKMNEGVVLVAMLSELRAWNIRIWGNCYNCIGPNCADQLDELDRSLRSLLDQLELEQRRNVTRLMILAINARDKQDELEKRQLDILKGQQQILGMLMEQHHAIGKIVSSSVQVASSTGGGGGTAPALGLVFRLLFDAVTQVRVKNEMVKRLLRRFKSTLNYLQPLIEEVAKSKRVLHLSEQEVEMFISEVENGVELIHKCSEVSKRVNYKKYKYTNKILDLDKSLQRLFFELKGQVERNLKEAMESANTIEAVIKKIEGGADQQKSELKSESQSSVPQPGSFAIGLDILNEQGHRDMNKDTQVDSTRNVEVVRPIEKSDAVEHQMETKSSCEVPPSPAGGLDVLNLQGSLDMDSTTSNIEAGVMDMEGIEVDDLKTNVHVKGTLEFAINVEKMGLMGVKKIEGGGGSQDIKIAVAETEPLSPAVQLDVQDEVHGTRDAKVTLEIRKNVKDAITTAAEPSSPSAEVGVKLDSSAFPSSSPLCTQAELKLPDKEKVIEEVVQVLRPSSSFLKIGSSLGIQALEPSSLSLVFTKSLFLPIFTETKISDEDNNQIQILVVGKNMIRGSHQMAPISLPHPVKLEIVVLNGDFGDRENWTRQEFDSKVVKERNGKRPLLTGDLSVTLRDGFSTIGDIKFTDNSSWIRGRKFRIGARVAPGYQGPRIREAMTDAFVVKDGPGLVRAAYNKHYPPMLEDEVWRLEKIGKYGAFHKRLAAENIHTVEDFLKMSVVDPVKLKKILGFGMSERMWEATLKHARTCEMGNKMYIFRHLPFVLFLNPICQVVKVFINGQDYPTRDLSNNNMVREESACILEFLGGG
ncbi:PREDICTED: uncharacterized protein LOC101303088 isoform X2 [Fragaria vesca subsp. vesca]|uniref:uncharacterized protein LOC101303088 isoform X2 n=1 Tax=Fragaria vesca subsp. vesca TaxID=101020 RepID=UPI0002C2F85B|nr:PREDICTED: uncharacterized protein LOC101303088 isoform X2 [Fragaria vesca subsp. vesca]